jgi:Uma2 family endonuclease
MNTARPAIPEADLLAIADRVEVVAGKVVPMSPVGALHHFIVGNITHLLALFVRAQALGVVFPDGLIYVLEGEGEGVQRARVPDVSFVHRDRYPKGHDLRKPLRLAPDLTVEVVSPNEDTNETLERVRDFLHAGTRQAWIVYPSPKEVHVYAPDTNTVRVYRNDDRFTVGAWLPLEVALADIFALPDWLFEAD